MRPSRLLLAALVAATAVAASAGASLASADTIGTPTRGATATQSELSNTSVTATAPACRTENLIVSIGAQEPVTSSGTHRGLVIITNDGSASCRLDGWVAISLTNAVGDVVKVPTSTVNQPGAPTPTTLLVGRSAFAGIKWVGCNKFDETCPTGNGLVFKVGTSGASKGAQLTDFPAPERSDITTKSLLIGSVQPSPQGVVAW